MTSIYDLAKGLILGGQVEISSDDNGADAIKDNNVGMSSLKVTLPWGGGGGGGARN